MSETPVYSRRTGTCLCGKVKVTAARASNQVGICHCGMCRKRSGGPLFAIDCGSDVSFEGQNYITKFNSSAWADRGFCNQCGANLFYHLKPKNQYIMPAGLFDDDKDFELHHEIFIDNKPSYYDFKNSTIKITGAEVFAKSK